MPTSYTSLLGLALPVTGELSGVWGDTVNDYITQYLDASVAGTQTISGSQTAVTLSRTTATSLSQAGSGATGSSQYQIINCTGNPAGLLTITAPAASKAYLILNNTSTNQSVKIVGTGPTTGVTVAATRCALVAWNGTDFELVATTDASQLTGVLAVANGGTGAATLTANNVILGNGTSAVQFVAPGTNGNVLTSNGTTWTSTAAATGLTGITQSVSPFETSLGASAGTSVTGLNATLVGYSAGTALTSGNYNTGIGSFCLQNMTTASDNVAVGYVSGGSSFGSKILGDKNTAIGNYSLVGNLNDFDATSIENTAAGYAAMQRARNSDYSAAFGAYALGVSFGSEVDGDYNAAFGHSAGRAVTTGAQNTLLGANAGFSGANNLTTGSNNIIIGYNAAASVATVSNEVTIGNTSITSTRLRGMVQLNAAMFEQGTLAATAATGTINFDVRTQSVLYYTANASGNWTLNVRAASAVTLDSVMTTGQSLTIAFLVTNGATAYYQTALTVDSISFTPKWQGGTAPTAGNASSIDAYVITIIKTAPSTFTVLESQTKFA